MKIYGLFFSDEDLIELRFCLTILLQSDELSKYPD